MGWKKKSGTFGHTKLQSYEKETIIWISFGIHACWLSKTRICGLEYQSCYSRKRRRQNIEFIFLVVFVGT